MGNQTYGPTLTNDLLENLQDLIQGSGIVFGVKATKALINKNRIEPDGPIGHFHDVGKAQSQRQGGNESFAARQRYDLTCPAGLDVVNPHIDPNAAAPASLKVR